MNNKTIFQYLYQNQNEDQIFIEIQLKFKLKLKLNVSDIFFSMISQCLMEDNNLILMFYIIV